MNGARIEINTTKAQLNITNKLRTFKMKSTPPQMEIERRLPSFTVNWSQVYAESGLKRPKQLMADTKQKAYNKVMEAIRRASEEGDMMMDIRADSPDMVPIIAVQNMRAALPDINIGSMPQNFPEFTWDKGELKISWIKGATDITWDEDFESELSVTPYSVEVKIRNFQKVKMNDQGNNKIEGRNLDKKI